MENQLAKQYLPLAGSPLIAHALHVLCSVPRIKAVFVVLAEADQEWSRHNWSALGEKLHPLFCGGSTRARSVANGLNAMHDLADEKDWVLVHDAARPCLTVSQVDKLLDDVKDDPVGGILALPVADTLKRADDDGKIAATVARDGLWQAQTPQMFRYGLLMQALTQNAEVTDEASAIQALGHKPKLVAGDAGNFKITWPADMLLAEAILKQRNSR